MDYHMFGQDYHGLSWIIICLARIIMDYHGLSYVWPGLSWIIMDYHMFGQDYHGLSWIIMDYTKLYRSQLQPWPRFTVTFGIPWDMMF